MKINKTTLAERIASKVGVAKKEAEDMLEAFTQIVTTEIKDGNEVTISGFGAFSAKTRKGRVGVNPQKPSEKINIPAVTVPKFKAGKALKDALKGKSSSLGSSQPTPPAPAPTPTPSPAPTTDEPASEPEETTETTM